MKYVSLILVILVFMNCTQEEKPKDIIVEELTPSNYSKIQGLFKDISPDSFYVYSAWDINKMEPKFKGTPMDSIQASILPYEIRSNYRLDKDFGACFKFPLDSTNTALIARVSGEYVSSALKLFVFDHKKDSVSFTVDLADIVGDAGGTWAHSSCIIKNKDASIFILAYHNSSYDHRVGDIENDTIVENWNNYYLSKLHNNVLDTISKDSALIVNRYPTIINRLMKMQ